MKQFSNILSKFFSFWSLFDILSKFQYGFLGSMDPVLSSSSLSAIPLDFLPSSLLLSQSNFYSKFAFFPRRPIISYGSRSADRPHWFTSRNIWKDFATLLFSFAHQDFLDSNDSWTRTTGRLATSPPRSGGEKASGESPRTVMSPAPVHLGESRRERTRVRMPPREWHACEMIIPRPSRPSRDGRDATSLGVNTQNSRRLTGRSCA